MGATDTRTGETLATFIYLLRRAGHNIVDAGVDGACEEIENAGGEAGRQGEELAAALRERAGNESQEDMEGAINSILSSSTVRTDLGVAPDRDSRIANVRRWLFGRSVPWLARIADRFPDGTVGVHWVLVQSFDDEARVMDPYPWDDIDEARAMPIADFMVRWELAGSESLAVE